MISWAIFLCSTIFSLGAYLVWPSRFNVPAHLGIGFCLIAYFVPTVILDVQDDYSDELVLLYVSILAGGALSYLVGLYLGFIIKPVEANFSFNVLSTVKYEERIIKITRLFLCIGIPSLIIGYMMMGFVPMFAEDPVSAKFFRGSYQVPFYTSIVYLSSFLILSNVTPISLMIWYKDKKRIFFLLATVLAVALMMLSLSRGPSFTGVMFAIIIIMSFKSKSSFAVLLFFMLFLYLFSSIFYYIIGIKEVTDVGAQFKHDDHIIWRVIAGGTVDIDDQLNFLKFFSQNPEWTYGRTVFGGLVPSHYEWNPSVYTLRVVNPGEDIATLVSGGLRLPCPIWGYVSFQWPGVVLFSFISGIIKGVILKNLKSWISKYKSILTATVIIIICTTIFEPLSMFYTLSLYSIPPTIILMFYVYRFKFR